MDKILEIEEIDSIALELKERLCNIEDFDKREQWEIDATNILIEHLRQYVKGDY